MLAKEACKNGVIWDCLLLFSDSYEVVSTCKKNISILSIILELTQDYIMSIIFSMKKGLNPGLIVVIIQDFI